MATPVEPDWTYENHATARGFRRVAGLDEVGRGSLAGPVLAAAVILRPEWTPPGIRDSKLLSPARRSALLPAILRGCVSFGLGAAGPEEIDRINILNATRVAMRRAVEAMPVRPDHVLIDALRLPDVPIEQTAITKGDRLCVSIAAASIVAKVVRDRIMMYYDRVFPGFDLTSNKGYGTARHLRAVAARGACAIHRYSFHGVNGKEARRPPGARPGRSLGRA
ncbi:MAG: ribonuclease HII [Acidobacteriota bacterium]